MLADGGWTCPDGGICEKDGVKAQFELMTRVEQLDDQNASKRIKAWAREVGIDIELAPVTDDAISNRHRTPRARRPDKYGPDYDAFLWGWSGDVPLAGLQLRRAAHGLGVAGHLLLEPGVRPHLAASRCTPWTRTKRIDLMHEAEKHRAARPAVHLPRPRPHDLRHADGHLAQLAAVAGRRGGRAADHQLAAAQSTPGGPGARAGARGGRRRRRRRRPRPRPRARPRPPRPPRRTRHGRRRRHRDASPRRRRPTATTAGISTGVVVLIALLALSIGAIVLLLATRGRRGGREPLEWDD